MHPITAVLIHREGIRETLVPWLHGEGSTRVTNPVSGKIINEDLIRMPYASFSKNVRDGVRKPNMQIIMEYMY